MSNLRLSGIATFAVVFLACSTSSAQQPIEITPIVSAFFGGSMSTYNGDVDLSDVTSYGGALDYSLNREVAVELSYSYAKPNAKFTPYPNAGLGVQSFSTDVVNHYVQLGARYTAGKGKFLPFLLIGGGVAIFSPTDQTTYSTETRFAMSFGAGLKLALGEKVALRVQGRLLMPLYFSGGGFWFGTGGASVGVTAGVPILQGDLGAGLTITM